MKTSITRTGIMGILTLATVFTAGYATGQSLFATTLNRTRAQAFHLTGQALFGSAAFGVFVPPNPTSPTNPLRLDFAENLRIPTTLNIKQRAQPSDPCRSMIQITLTGGTPVLSYGDPGVLPEGITQFTADLSQIQPRTSQCRVQ